MTDAIEHCLGTYHHGAHNWQGYYCPGFEAAPSEAHGWVGPTCGMCDGTGRHRVGITIQDGICTRVIGWEENGMHCPACNGHGRDAA